jgi:HlyD family secretion protein
MTMTQTRKRRISPWWAMLAIPAVAAGLIATGVIKPPARPGAASDASKLETARVTQGNFRVSVTGPGTLQAVRSLDVKAKINGTVALLPDVGDRVQKGQLIARLESDSFERAVENAQLSLSKAQTQLASTRANQANNRASQQQQIASAQAQYDNARLNAQNAQTNLKNQQSLFTAGGVSAQSVRDAQSQLEQAQTNLESARVALQTARNAVSIKATSDSQDVRNLQLGVEQAAIMLRNAQTDLANTKLYAPMNGVVSSVTGQVGGPASSQAPLFTLLDVSRMDLPVQVDETEISRVKLGQRAEVTLDAITGQKFTGTVTTIAPSAQVVQNIAVFIVTVTMPNPDGQLRAGMTAEAEIISQQIENATLVPKRAVQTVRRRSYVDVLGQDGKTTEPVRVTTGPDDGSSIVITDGLEPGQTVVLPTRAQRGTSTTGAGP